MREEKYNVLTWDVELQSFTPHDGLSVPLLDVSLWGVRRALRELQGYGYSCDRDLESCDPHVFVERIQ